MTADTSKDEVERMLMVELAVRNVVVNDIILTETARIACIILDECKDLKVQDAVRAAVGVVKGIAR